MARPDVDHRLAVGRVRTWRLFLFVGLCILEMLIGKGGNDLVMAAEWSVAPLLSMKADYNSNLLVNTGNNEVIGYWITPTLRFKGATETLEVEAESRANFVHYYGDVDREYTNLYFPLKTSYRLDRHLFGFEGGFTRDNTLIGELQETGLVLGFTQRSMWTAMPTWTVGITERLSWKSGYQFMDAQYQDGTRFGLVGYQVHGVNGGPHYNLSELDQIHVTGEYNLVRIPTVGLESTYYGAQAGWTHDFGNGVVGSVSGGGRLVSSTQDVPAIPGILGILLGRSSDRSVTSQEVVWLYQASLRKQFEQTMMQIDGGREIRPSGFGRLLQTDRVGGSISHNISETLSVSLHGALYFVSGLTTTENSRPLPHTRFFSVSPRVSWKFAEWWSINVSYTYAERTVDAFDVRNDSNAISIMLTYGGEKWSVSR